MLNVRNDQLVVEHKGIYSIEKFLIARRLMYWQVYLHKTALTSEYMLVKTLKRAKELVQNGGEVFATPALSFFLHHTPSLSELSNNSKNPDSPINMFARLDDSDVNSAIKVWQRHSDFILSHLSTAIMNRRLYRINVRNVSFPEKKIDQVAFSIMKRYKIPPEDVHYFLISDTITNSAYSANSDNINILHKNGRVSDIHDASDINLTGLTKNVKKYILCYPKNLNIKQ